MLACKAHNLFFGDALYALQFLHLLFPGCSVDEGIHKHVGSHAVALHGVIVSQFHVVLHRREQVVAEVALLQFVYFFEQELSHLVECLSFAWRPGQDEGRIVHHCFGSSPGFQHFHLLVDVQVNESGRSVRKHLFNHLQCVGLQRSRFVESPSHPQLFCFQSDDGCVLRFGNRFQFREGGLFHIVARLPLSEVAVDGGNHLVGVEVSRHADGHVVGHIPFFEVSFDVGDRRVLQMFLCANGGLCAIGVVGEELGQQSIVEFVDVAGEVNVIFFIDSLQFGMEPAYHHILEAVGLNLGPVLHFVRRNVFGIAGHIVAGVGIGSFRSDSRHQLVVFVGNEILCSQLAHRVNLVVGLFTF